MIKKDVGSKLKAWSVTYGIMFLTLFNALYWQHEPQILQQDTISFKYLLANVLHGFSVTEAVDIDNTRNAINSFAKGIHYTDEYVAEFIEQIDQIQKPITLVFYGDHLPGIYANEMDKDGLNLHETDYFIYSNKYAQQNGAKNSLNKSKIISPNDFPAMVAEKVNAKISPYYALLTAVYQQIPAIYMGNNPSSEKRQVVDYVTENEQILTEKQLSAEQKEILEDLRLIQYDITAGENYVKETKFMQFP